MGWRVALWVGVMGLVLVFLYLVRGILFPFIVSLVLAAVLAPLVTWLERRKVPRGRAIGLVMFGFLAFIVSLMLILTPQVTRQVVNLTAQVEQITTTLMREDEQDHFFLRWNPTLQREVSPTEQNLDNLFAKYGATLAKLGLPNTRKAFTDQYINSQRPRIVQALRQGFETFLGFATSMFSQLVMLLLALILTPMILAEMSSIQAGTSKWIPPSIREQSLGMVQEIGDVFTSYLRGVFSVIALFSVTVTLLLLLLGVPYAILLGPLFGLLYIVPYLGNIVSCVVIFLLTGFSNVTGSFGINLSSSWVWGGVAMGIFIAVGFFFDHYLYPKMVGNSVGLSPLVSMFVILSGGALFGLPGMLVAFPLAGAVKIVLDRLMKVTNKDPEALLLPTLPMRHRSTA